MNHFNYIKITLLSSILLVPSFASQASAIGGLSLGLVGAATLQNPRVKNGTSTVDVKGIAAYGGGLTAEINVGASLGIEADLLYLNHKFSQDTAEFFGTTITSTYSSGYIHIPVLLRFGVLPFVNMGAGLYYSRVVSSWNVSASGHNAVSTDYGKNDTGFVLAVGSGFPITPTLSLFGDLRYARSLTETARSSGDALAFSDFQILIGLRTDIL